MSISHIRIWLWYSFSKTLIRKTTLFSLPTDLFPFFPRIYVYIYAPCLSALWLA